jgi:hypothetical protein
LPAFKVGGDWRFNLELIEDGAPRGSVTAAAPALGPPTRTFQAVFRAACDRAGGIPQGQRSVESSPARDL